MSLVRDGLKRYKKHFFYLILALCILAFPMYKFSEYVSAFFVFDIKYEAAETVNVDYPLEVKIFDNFFAENKAQSFSNLIIDTINKSQKEIYIAMFSFNIIEIRDALGKAADRGVKVNLYSQYSKIDDFDTFIAPIKDKINLVYTARYEDEKDFYNMHHKFLIVDPGDDNEVLITGAWNWSYMQQDLDPNIMIMTKDREIIRSYLKEAERLGRGFSGYNKFRDILYRPFDKVINYKSGEKAEIWFSPGREGNSIETRAIDIIRGAKKSIDLAMTFIGSYRMVNEILEKAKEGLNIRIIVNINTKDDPDSVVPYLESIINEKSYPNLKLYYAGTEATADNPDFSIFHHHNLLVDDQIAFISTSNWTGTGFFFSDENTLVFYSKNVAEKLKEIFEKVIANVEKT